MRETEQLVRRLGSASPAKAKKGDKSVDPDIRRLQNELTEKLAAKVLFQHAAKGNGKLVIHYNSLDELDGILSRIQ